MSVLVLRHSPTDRLGFLGDNLHFELQVHDCKPGKPLPDPLDYDGVIILGGPQRITEPETFPGLADEVELARRTYGRRPLLGICLGAQILALAFGGEVRAAREEEIEKDWLPIHLTPEGASDPLFAGVGGELTPWLYHADVFTLPSDARLLATSPRPASNQAFAMPAPATYAMMFHIEWDGINGDGGEPGLATDETETVRNMQGGLALEPAARTIARNFLAMCEGHAADTVAGTVVAA